MTNSEYEELMKSRAALRSEIDSGGIEDLSGNLEDGVVESGQRSQQDFNVARNQPKNSGLSKVGEATTAAGAAGANPYVAGAGLALQTVGAVDDAKRQAEQAKIDAYNKKIMDQRSAIRNFFA